MQGGGESGVQTYVCLESDAEFESAVKKGTVQVATVHDKCREAVLAAQAPVSVLARREKEEKRGTHASRLANEVVFNCSLLM